MPSKSNASKPPMVTSSSGNVFADLNLPNPEVLLTKAQLVRRIRELMTQRKLSQAVAAELLGIDQPKVSALVRGNVSGYTIERLFKFLNRLGQDVEIVIRPKKTSSAVAETRVRG
jgi:predicted XRE-type DNA-binding protein